MICKTNYFRNTFFISASSRLKATASIFGDKSFSGNQVTRHQIELSSRDAKELVEVCLESVMTQVTYS